MRGEDHINSSIIICFPQKILFGRSNQKQLGVRNMYLVRGRGAYRILVWKPEDRRQLGRARRRYENDIKMDLPEVRRGMDCIDLSKDMDSLRTLVKMVMNLWVL